MQLHEHESSTEHQFLLEYWMAQIETRWQKIPEFKVDPEKLRHLAIICDGNRRSGLEKGLPAFQGHTLGAEATKGISRACRDWGIEVLTLWVFSTENWKRDPEQVDFLMELFWRYGSTTEYVEELKENKVRLTHFGRRDRLETHLEELIEDLEEITRSYDPSYFLNIALDYGGLDELGRAFVKMLAGVEAKRISPAEISENSGLILSYLDSSGQPHPDLIIRTGFKPGEVPHTSGFMPLQTSYSSWMFLPEYFPDLSPDSLVDALSNFVQYKRRFGA